MGIQAVENNNKEPFKKSEQASRKKEGDLSPEIPGENNKLQVNDGKVSKGGKNPRWRRDNPAAYIINYQMLDQSNLNYVKEQFAQVSSFHS